ncbi:MAG: hypothetical protein M1822_009635 [Bathelium mastoideum]|nr:MAG: hypothetical protein M1822_009635 [Bathelium mastoideum]
MKLFDAVNCMMQANQSLAAKRLDLSARSIDLLSVIAKSTSSLTDVARDIISWQGREGLSESQLTFALDATKDFAQPNANGEVILANLEKTASRLYGLQMVMPGAIGRAILADPSLSWLATTQAVLLKYHSLDYSSVALCDLALTSLVPPDDYRRSAYLARMFPVISKLVESIALHSTNSGCGVSDFPEALQKLPQHFQDASQFSRSVHAIQSATSQHLLVQMNYCVTGLLDWIVNHWQGVLTVSNDNKIVYQAPLGKRTNRLFFVITGTCFAETKCFEDKHIGKVNIAVAMDATLSDLKTIYVGTTDPLEGRSTRGYRSHLYDIQVDNQNEYTQLTKKEQICAKKNAQEILRSIVNLSVLPFHNNSMRLGFKIQKKQAGQPFRWWLPRVPGLLQGNFGASQAISMHLSHFHTTNLGARHGVGPIVAMLQLTDRSILTIL